MQKLVLFESGTIGNGFIVCASAYTGSRSAVGYGLTNCRTAKGLYAASALCSAAAVTNGGIAHVAALQAEDKPIPQHLQYIKEYSRKPVWLPYGNNGNLGFIMPGAGSGDFSFLSETIAKIPFKQIGQLVGLSFIYS